jgi:hypothetical protein
MKKIEKMVGKIWIEAKTKETEWIRLKLIRKKNKRKMRKWIKREAKIDTMAST